MRRQLQWALAFATVVCGSAIAGTGMGSGGLAGGPGFNGTLNGDLTVNGDAGVSGIVTAAHVACTGSACVQNTTATQSLLIQSDTNDATTSTSVGAVTIKSSVDVANTDLVLDVQKSDGTSILNLNESGKLNVFNTISTTDNGTLNVSVSGAGTVALSTNSGNASVQLNGTALKLVSSTDLDFTDTASTGTIISDTSASTATSTVAAITLAPTATLDANDLVVEVNNAAAGHLLGLDLEGDLDAVTVTGSTSVASPTYYVTANTGITANFNGGYVAIKGAASNPAAIASLQNSSGSEFAQVTLNTGGTVGGFYVQPVQTVTVANDGNAGTAPATTVTPTSNVINVAYNDPQNSSVGTFTETNAAFHNGAVIYLVHTGSGGSVAFADSGGVLEGSCTIDLDDVMTVVYTNSRFYVVDCRAN